MISYCSCFYFNCYYDNLIHKDFNLVFPVCKLDSCFIGFLSEWSTASFDNK